MNKNVLIISLCVLTTILICFILYNQNNRYYMQIAANGLVYKIDKKTGQMWQISGVKERLIVSQELQDAISLAKQSYLLDKHRTTEEIINEIMTEKKET